MSTPNVRDDPYEYDDSDPEGYRSGVLRLTPLTGATANAVKAFEIPPGQSICPYHYEFEEEWLLVLEGDQLRLRTPEPERSLRAGDVVSFPPGPAGAHKLTNGGADTARVLMFSSAREPSVAVYPDSDKLGVWPGLGEDEMMLRRADGHVGYYEGETTPQ